MTKAIPVILFLLLMPALALAGDYERGLEAIDEGDCEQAIACFSTLIKDDPNCASAYFHRGRARAANEEYDKSISDLTEAIRLEPQHASSYNHRGMAFMGMRDWRSAIRDFTEAIRLDPGYNYDVYGNRGVAFCNICEFDKAISDFSELINFNPSDSDAYCKRARAYVETQEPENAIADYSKATALTPNNEFAFWCRGACFARKKCYAQAACDWTIFSVQLFKDTVHDHLRLQPGRAEEYYKRGRAWARKHEYLKALVSVITVLGIDPKHGEANNLFAWILATCHDENLRDGAMAVEYAATACELSNWKDPASLETLAAAHAECGNFEEAINWQQKAIELAWLKCTMGARCRLELYEEGKPYRDR